MSDPADIVTRHVPEFGTIAQCEEAIEAWSLRLAKAGARQRVSGLSSENIASAPA
jgi:hypothetical protein